MRSNVFITAGNEHRETSVGGRRQACEGWARLNTDNASASDCALVARAEVVGVKSRKEDTRKTIFTVELPEPSEGCAVYVQPNGYLLAGLVRMGAALCTAKGAIEQIQGVEQSNLDLVRKGEIKVETARQILREMEAQASELPEVILPGGVTLARALACVKFCEALAGSEPARN